MGIDVWDHLAQLQFDTFKILIYKICKQKQYKKKLKKKNSLVQKKKEEAKIQKF